VWAHSGGNKGDIRAHIVQFCAGRDVEQVPPSDESLLLADLATNEAALLALSQARVLSRAEAKNLAKAHIQLRSQIEAGEFRLDPSLEDVHINLEAALRDEAGEAAGKLHSGRSRNDQVACDLRQWHRDRILDHITSQGATIETFLNMAEEERSTVMPGYSHHQRAFVTTWGHLIASYAQAWLRDVERGLEVLNRVNQSPLGAAAGFGTSWRIDRELLAKLLGFEGLVENSLDAVSSRLEVETDVAAWLAIWMTHASTIAQDLILYSTEEFGWMQLAPETTTGSSIMPQKRNPDFAEVIKGKTSLVHGALSSLLSLGKGLPSGYQRDSQYSKQIGQDIWREVAEIPEVLGIVFGAMKMNRREMKEATREGFLDAAEWADAIAQNSKLPFRDVYKAIGMAVNKSRKAGRLSLPAINQALKDCSLDYKVGPKLASRFKSPEDLIGARFTVGSPNPDRVMENIENLSGELSGLMRITKSVRKQIESGNRARLTKIKELAGK